VRTAGPAAEAATDHRLPFLLRLGRGELVDGAYGDVDEVVLAIAVAPGCLGRGGAGEGGAAEGGGL
jgi:hypothetical protein